MKKVLLISYSEKRSLSSKLIEGIFKAQSVIFVSANEIEGIINAEKPDFIMLDLKIKPVNGMDMMSVLRHVDGNIRLRVAILTAGFFKKSKAIVSLNPQIDHLS